LEKIDAINARPSLMKNTDRESKKHTSQETIVVRTSEKSEVSISRDNDQ